MSDSAPQIISLLAELKEIRESFVAMKEEFAESIAEACPQSVRSAKNLIDYLALRNHDLRDLQSRLTALGLSSLGRSESGALAALEAVISIVESLAGERRFAPPPHSGEAVFKPGSAILVEHADELLGPAPRGRVVRIMVTMPSEAAQDYELVRCLIEAGMDVMRVNCAHDSEREWECMISHMRRATQETGKACKVLMDLAGPKLRTGSIRRGSHVVRWRAGKDTRGIAIAPASIVLAGQHDSAASLHTADVVLPVPKTLISSVLPGDSVQIKASNGKVRKLSAIRKDEHTCLCTCERSAYVLSRTEWTLVRDGQEIAAGHIGNLPFVESPIRLHPGDLLVLTKEESKQTKLHRDIPHISCTLPEVFSTAKAGQPIFFDDGKIEGRIQKVQPDHMVVEIVHAGAGEAKLRSAKGINLPETDFGIAAMTEKDLRDLDFIAEHADMAALSFARRPEDVVQLHQELASRGKGNLGIVLKIENRTAFENLPLIMLAALRHHPVGIMVARGDLAIEVGFERLAEVQEEILWLSEAAHMPVIWATQVLESLTKTGIPSRAEVTDAAMGVRAECVMLNKGEHILDSVRFLDRVLHRMQAHQMKKQSMLRRLAVAQVNQADCPVEP